MTLLINFISQLHGILNCIAIVSRNCNAFRCSAAVDMEKGKRYDKWKFFKLPTRFKFCQVNSQKRTFQKFKVS